MSKAEKIAEKILASDTPDEYIKKSGIDLLEIYRELGRIALHATIVAKDRDGEPINLGPDNKSRLPAIQTILELKKHLKDKNVITQVGIFNDPTIQEDADRILKLRKSL